MIILIAMKVSTCIGITCTSFYDVKKISAWALGKPFFTVILCTVIFAIHFISNKGILSMSVNIFLSSLSMSIADKQ